MMLNILNLHQKAEKLRNWRKNKNILNKKSRIFQAADITQVSLNQVAMFLIAFQMLLKLTGRHIFQLRIKQNGWRGRNVY